MRRGRKNIKEGRTDRIAGWEEADDERERESAEKKNEEYREKQKGTSLLERPKHLRAGRVESRRVKGENVATPRRQEHENWKKASDFGETRRGRFSMLAVLIRALLSILLPPVSTFSSQLSHLCRSFLSLSLAVIHLSPTASH